jgi:hypothetical protein
MISRDNDIANELQEIIPGAAWPGLVPTFGEVPAGYFEQLPAKIMQKIELETISPLLSEAPKTVPFTVPQGYFEQLSAQILNKIEIEEELESISPLLAGIGIPKQFPLSAPEGYFAQLTANIMADIETTPAKAKVVPMRKTYLKWAAAACFIAMISAGTLFFMHDKQQIATPATENALADISDQEIVEYLQTHMDAFDKEELLSLASLNTTPGTVPLPETSELSDEAIQRYLEKTGL